MPKYEIEYDSNNSGGVWWLSDGDWLALELAGWDVDWVKDSEHHSGDRWLGALATGATLTLEVEDEYVAKDEGIRNFEKNTGQDVEDIGCECCGPPHSIYVKEVAEGA